MGVMWFQPLCPHRNTSLTTIHSQKYLHKKFRTQLRGYSTPGEHKNEKKHNEKGKKNSFTLPTSGVPNPWAMDWYESATC